MITNTRTFKNQTIEMDLSDVLKGEGEQGDQCADFLGATPEMVRARRYAWQEGAGQIKHLPGFSGQAEGAQFVKVWSDYDGDEMDVERYKEDLPFLSRRIKKTGSKVKRLATIRVNIGEGCNTDAADMLWKAYVASKIVDELEASGTRCEIVVECLAMHFFTSKPADHVLTTRVKIKSHGDPLNLALMASCFAPWFLRYWLFDFWRTNFANQHRESMGRPQKSTRTSPEEVIIDQGECLSERAAKEFLTRYNTNRKAA